MMRSRNILVVSPHPDDAEIGMGAVISKFRRQGKAVTIAVCTGPGDLVMEHSGETVLFNQRQVEQNESAAVLGCQVEFLDFGPASKFDQVSQADCVQKFTELFQGYREVYIPLPAYNRDHTIVWESALAAVRPGKNDHVQMYAYEQAFSNCLGPQLPDVLGKKYFRVNSLDLETQRHALILHRSQMNQREDSIYGPEGIQTLARLRGLEVGLKYAQRVYVVREVVL